MRAETTRSAAQYKANPMLLKRCGRSSVPDGIFLTAFRRAGGSVLGTAYLLKVSVKQVRRTLRRLGHPGFQ